MLRRLLKDSAAYTLGRALTGVVGLVLLPLYTRYLAPAEFGLYDMGGVVIGIATLVVGVEVAQGAARFYCDDPDERSRRDYFSTALVFTLAAFALFCVICVPLAPYVATPLLGPGASGATVLLVALAASATAAFRLATAQLRWLMRPWLFLSCSVLQVATSAAIAVWLLIRAHAGAHALFWGMIAGNALGFAVALGLGRAGLGLVFAPARLRQMLAFSLPLVASSSAVWVTLYVDRLAIKALMTMTDLGLYAAAYRFAAAIDVVMAAFEAAFMPLIYATYRDPETPSALAKLTRLMVLLGTAVLVALAALCRELVQLLAAPEYASAAPLVPILAAGVFLTRLSALAPGLWIASRTARIAWINLGISLANLALNLLLIPWLGVVGAALATVGAGLLGLTINLRASQAHYPVPHQWARLLGGLLLVALSGALLLQLSAQLPPLAPSSVALKLAVAGAMLVAALLVLFSSFERAQLLRTIGRYLKP